MSSTEAEYVSLSKGAKETAFMTNGSEVDTRAFSCRDYPERGCQSPTHINPSMFSFLVFCLIRLYVSTPVDVPLLSNDRSWISECCDRSRHALAHRRHFFHEVKYVTNSGAVLSVLDCLAFCFLRQTPGNPNVVAVLGSLPNRD